MTWDDGGQPRISGFMRTEWGNMKALQEQIDRQTERSARTERALTSQLSQLQGDLAQRVDRLTRAFEAFVELSRLRDELVLHTDARRWRVAAKDLVETALAGRAPTQPLPTVDVPGYWLAPMVRALPGLLAGGGHQAELAEAQRRDERRTTVFLACLATLLRRQDLADVWVPRATEGRDDPQLTVADRALWLAAVDGQVPASAAHQKRLLDARLARAGAEPREKLVTGFVENPPGDRRTGRRDGRFATSPEAARTSLQTWCDVVGTAAAAAAGAPSPGDVDPVLSVVRSLVEEGSAEERDLLDHAERLSAVVAGADEPTPSGWDDPAGSVTELLDADLRDTDHPARQRLALRVLGREVRAAADRLVELVGPAEDVPPRRTTPTLTARETRVRNREASRRSQVLGTAAALAAVFLVLTFTVSVLWGIGAAVAVIGAGGWWLMQYDATVERTREQQRRAAEQERSAEQATQKAEASRAAAEEAAARRSELDRDLASIDAAAAAG